MEVLAGVLIMICAYGLGVWMRRQIFDFQIMGVFEIWPNNLGMRPPIKKYGQALAINMFMLETGYVCIACPKCAGDFIKKIFCSTCCSKGYVVIPKDRVMAPDLPCWRGFVRELDNPELNLSEDFKEAVILAAKDESAADESESNQENGGTE